MFTELDVTMLKATDTVLLRNRKMIERNGTDTLLNPMTCTLNSNSFFFDRFSTILHHALPKLLH